MVIYWCITIWPVYYWWVGLIYCSDGKRLAVKKLCRKDLAMVQNIYASVGQVILAREAGVLKMCLSKCIFQNAFHKMYFSKCIWQYLAMVEHIMHLWVKWSLQEKQEEAIRGKYKRASGHSFGNCGTYCQSENGSAQETNGANLGTWTQ